MTAVNNQQELAQALGCGQSNVSKMMRDPEWQWGRGPWTGEQVAAIAAWRENRRALNNSTAGGVIGRVGVQPGIGGQANATGQGESSNEEYSEESAQRDLKAELASLPAERQVKVELALQRIATAKLQRELLLGQWVKKAEMDEHIVDICRAFKSEIVQFPMRAARLVGKDETEIRETLTDWCRDLCNRLRDWDEYGPVPPSPYAGEGSPPSAPV